MDFFLGVHTVVAWLIFGTGAAALLLGVAWLILRRGQTAIVASSADTTRLYFRYALIATSALGLLQALLGLVLAFVYHLAPGTSLHYVYGLLVLLSVPLAYMLSDQARVRRDIIYLTIAVVVVIAAAVRAFVTGAGAR